MKKIMFNDKLLLTKEVLEGRKTQTRRLLPWFMGAFGGDTIYPTSVFFRTDRYYVRYNIDFCEPLALVNYPKYKVGEIVAIAQSYKSVDEERREGKNKAYIEQLDSMLPEMKKLAGWNNKMFVKADLMPHQIRITNIKVERLQDISDEDCLTEGVVVNEPKIKGGAKMYYPCKYLESCAKKVGWGRVFHTPREAFANLIDKVSGKGTWERNPWVWVYEFELVK